MGVAGMMMRRENGDDDDDIDDDDEVGVDEDDDDYRVVFAFDINRVLFRSAVPSDEKLPSSINRPVHFLTCSNFSSCGGKLPCSYTHAT